MKNILKIVGLTFLLVWSSLYLGFYLGRQVEVEKQKAVIKATFAPIEDCLIVVKYSGKLDGEYWTVSDFMLHQDWEKNKNRKCDVEVGELLHKFLENL